MTPADLAARVGGLPWEAASTITAPNGARIGVPSGQITPENRDLGKRIPSKYGPKACARIVYESFVDEDGQSRSFRTADQLRSVARDLRAYAAELDELASVADKITRPAEAPVKARGKARGKVPLARFAGIDMDEPQAAVVEGS